MKRHILFLSTAAFLALALNARSQMPAPVGNSAPTGTSTNTNPAFKNDAERFGYAIGLDTAESLKANLTRYDLPIDQKMLEQGLKDGVEGGSVLITPAEKKDIINDVRKFISEKMEEKRKQLAEENRVKGEKNKAEGEAFLQKNLSANGVVVLPSGLQYQVLTDGSGPSPKMGDEIEVNYRGTFLDGTEFDSSYKRNQALKMRLSPTGLIKGWTEALPLMKAGSKWKLFVPSDLAYGPTGHGQAIGPNAALIFEIELVSFHAGPATPAASVTPAPSAPLTSDIIKVPSAEEMKKGAKIETIKAEDLDKERSRTNN